MRSFERSVVLCALILALTPAPAQAWFEWLDYLSGPGPFYGYKIDVRVWCSGAPAPWKGLRESVDRAIVETLKNLDKPQIPPRPPSVSAQWEGVLEKLSKSNQALTLTDPTRFEGEIKRLRAVVVQFNQAAVQSGQAVVQSNQGRGGTEAALATDVLKLGEDLHRVIDTFERAAASIASTGIFVSLCKNDRMRAFAVELGFTTLQASSNPDYARDYSIRLNTITAAVSYRFPLSPDRDVIDIGASAGMYLFSSRGFDTFSGLIFEPVFVDLHGPTKLVEAGGLKQLGGLFTFRLSLVFFRGGFDGSQFASVPSKPRHISGLEATPSATVFFNLTPLLWRRPPSTVSRLGALR